MKSKGDVWRKSLLHIFCLMLVIDSIDRCLIRPLCTCSSVVFILHIYSYTADINRSCTKDCEDVQRVCESTISQDVLCTKRMIKIPPFVTWTDGNVKIVIIMIIMVIYRQQDVSWVLFLSMKTKCVMFGRNTWMKNMCIFFRNTYIVVLQFCATPKCT